MAASLRIRLLGTLEISVGARRIPVTAWKRKRPLHLLQALALAPGLALHREEVIDLLWPEKDLASGANNLHRALHDLRRVVGDAAPSLDKGVVRAAPGTWVDVAEFEKRAHATAMAPLLEAVDLYRGDLCRDEPYGEPMAARREELRRLYREASLRLSRLALAEGQLDRAAAVLQRLVSADATDEEAQRALVSVLVQGGRRQEARRQIDAARAALRDAGLPESRELARLADDVASPPAAPTAAVGWRRVARRLLGTAEPSPLRGRDAEVDRIADLARAGQGALLLSGEAGVGKTRVAIEAARIAGDAGAVVLAGAGVDLSEPAPFMPFIEAWLDHLRAAGAAEQPVPFLAFVPTPGGAMQQDKLRLFRQAHDSLVAMGHGRPVCLVLDDIHLMDESSLHLLHFLARATRTERLLLIATCRDEEIRVGGALHSLIGALVREKLARHVVLERLDRAATLAQARDIAKDAADRFVGAVFDLTGGNPFFTEEVVLSLRGNAGRQAQGRAAKLDVPDNVAQMVLARVDRLPAAARRLLQAASIAGQRFTFDLAAEASELPRGEALEALESAVAARFLEEGDGAYAFRHALVREALGTSLSAARRRHLHAAIAGFLERTEPERHEEIAHHHRAAGALDRALPHLVKAGRSAASRLGLGEAVAFFQEALRCMDGLRRPPDGERFALLLGAAQMCFAISDLDAVIRHAGEAARIEGPGGYRPSAAQRAQALRWVALGHVTAGNLDEANRALGDAMEALGGAPDDPVWAQVLYLLAQVRWHECRFPEAYAAAEQCLARAERCGDAESIAKGYEMLALACHSLGEWQKGVGYEEKRQEVCGGQLDVAQAFDVHL